MNVIVAAAMTVVPSIVQLMTLPLCPESPKYTLCVKNMADQAEKDLKKLRAKEDVSVVSSKIETERQKGKGREGETEENRIRN